MPNFRTNKKGIALFIVLATIFVVILLGNIVLGIISSQSRLTHHQVSRIQAYYAAWAGVMYAMEKIRLNDTAWIPSPDTVPNTVTRILNEPDLPSSIREVSVTVGALGSGISGTREINATATYTYQP